MARPAGKGMTFKTTMKGLNRLGEITMGDLGIHLVTFLALIVSLGIGIHKLLSGPTIINTLAISVVWIIYAAIPIWLLIWFAFLGRGTTLHLWCRCAPPALSCPDARLTYQWLSIYQALSIHACLSPCEDLGS